jgi:hypothetical protein
MSGIIDQAWLDAHPGALTRAKANASLKGYAAPPGTGPEGETCRTCKHYTHKGGSHQCSPKRYPACGLMERFWTHGPGTDIKAKSPACKFWEMRG